MRLKYSKFEVYTYLFFIFFFLTYINSRVTLKYVALILYQAYLIFLVKNKRYIKSKRCSIVPIIGIVISLIISLLVNFSLSGMVKTISLIDLLFFVYYLFPRAVKNASINEKQLIKIITDTLFITLAIAFLFYYNDTRLATGRSNGIVIRHLFSFGEASIVGFLCFIEFSLSFFLLCENRILIKKTVCLGKMAFSFYMAYLANIRAGIYVMIVFVAYYIYMNFPKIKHRKIIGGFTIFFFILFAGIYLFDMSLDFQRLDYLLSNRLSNYSRSITEVFLNNKVLFGMGSFRNSDVVNLAKIQVDNNYIDIFYQYGLLVLLFFVSILVSIYKKIKSIIHITKEQHEYSIYDKFIEAYFISILVYSMVEKNLFSISSALSVITFLLFFWYIEKADNSLN